MTDDKFWTAFLFASLAAIAFGVEREQFSAGLALWSVLMFILNIVDGILNRIKERPSYLR